VPLAIFLYRAIVIPPRDCHSERSEESPRATKAIPHCVRAERESAKPVLFRAFEFAFDQNAEKNSQDGYRL
jgi:hypothetical protein